MPLISGDPVLFGGGALAGGDGAGVDSLGSSARDHVDRVVVDDNISTKLQLRPHGGINCEPIVGAAWVNFDEHNLRCRRGWVEISSVCY